jgi:TPR repeat protein
LSADQGNADAQLNYGLCLRDGRGVGRDYVKAADYFKLSADQGNDEAQCNYGLCCLTGLGVSHNYSEAVKSFRIAARKNLSSADSYLGICLLAGLGSCVDFEGSEEMFKQGADLGHIGCQFMYGLILFERGRSEGDIVDAAQYFRQAAEEHVMEAQINYAVCLFEGLGISVDYVSAARYWKAAADQGNAIGMFNYGLCLLDGKGVSVDVAEAVRYFEIASREGHTGALVNFGFCLHKGQGIKRDVLRSAKYFKAAADQNDPVGQFNYGVCCYRGEGFPIDFGEAAEYFRLSSNQNYGPAHRAYSSCLAHGRGVPVMFRKSLIYLYRSGMPRGTRWDDVRLSDKSILVKSFTPIADLPNCVIEFKAKTVMPVQVPESGSGDVSMYQFRNKVMRAMLHPDAIRAEHLSEFKVDANSLQTVKVLGIGVSGTTKLMIGQGSKKFAVKCYSQSCWPEIFCQEFEAMCRLTDPCIVPCYGFSVTFGDFKRRSAALVMKYMKHGSLRDVLDSVKSGSPPDFWDETGIAIIVCGIVYGLELVHSQGIIHRDIKPENLMLDGRGHCLIGDFGSSRFFSAGCRLSQEVTTPLYAAPEQLNGLAYTNKIDVFSFAVVLHEILGGELDDSLVFLMSVMMGERLNFPESMSEDMKSLISRCWAQNADDRPSFHEILAELKRIDFKILPGVDSSRVREFASGIEANRAKIFLNTSHTQETSLAFKEAMRCSG